MNWRYRFVLLFFCLLFFSVMARLYYWQVVRAQELASMGQDQYGRVIKLNPTRGEIMTSDGFAIAANKISYLAFANPKEVKDVNQESQLLTTLLGGDTASISGLL